MPLVDNVATKKMTHSQARLIRSGGFQTNYNCCETTFYKYVHIRARSAPKAQAVCLCVCVQVNKFYCTLRV